MATYKELFGDEKCCKCGFKKALSVGLHYINGKHYCKKCKDK